MAYEGIVSIVTFLLVVVFLYVGAQEVLAHNMTLGELVSFNALVLLAIATTTDGPAASAATPLRSGEIASLVAQQQDTDGDGYSDDYELSVGLDPYDASDGPLSDSTGDSDGDGMSDDEEFDYGTDPYAFDSDGDGEGDGTEVYLGSDPWDPYSYSLDLDGDLLTNEQEIAIGSDLSSYDTDGDGLDDGREVNDFGTDPTRADSDGDGISDAAELGVSDPLTPNTDGTDADGDRLTAGQESSMAVSAARTRIVRASSRRGTDGRHASSYRWNGIPRASGQPPRVARVARIRSARPFGLTPPLLEMF